MVLFGFTFKALAICYGYARLNTSPMFLIDRDKYMIANINPFSSMGALSKNIEYRLHIDAVLRCA